MTKKKSRPKNQNRDRDEISHARDVKGTIAAVAARGATEVTEATVAKGVTSVSLMPDAETLSGATLAEATLAEATPGETIAGNAVAIISEESETSRRKRLRQHTSNLHSVWNIAERRRKVKSGATIVQINDLKQTDRSGFTSAKEPNTA